MGFSRQKYWSGLPFRSLMDHILSVLSTMTCPSWVALHGIAHSFIELGKTGFLWPWMWVSPHGHLLHFRTAAACSSTMQPISLVNSYLTVSANKIFSRGSIVQFIQIRSLQNIFEKQHVFLSFCSKSKHICQLLFILNANWMSRNCHFSQFFNSNEDKWNFYYIYIIPMFMLLWVSLLFPLKPTWTHCWMNSTHFHYVSNINQMYSFSLNSEGIQYKKIFY